MSDPYELAACGLLITGAHGEIARVNRTLCGWLEYTAEELHGRKFQDLLSIGSKLFHYTQWMPLLHMQGSIAEVQLELVAKSGKILPVLVNAAMRPGADRVVDIAVLMVVDRRLYERQLLEARRLAEELLVRERQAREATAAAIRRLESFVAGAPTAIAVLKGPDLVFELANDRFCALMGGAVTLGMPVRDCLGIDESSSLWSTLSSSYREGTTSVVMDYVSELPRHRTIGSGLGVHLDVVVQATLAADGAREGVIVHVSDVSERVQARLRLEEKNRELESFAYVVSHDLKAPLRALRNLAAWIKEDDADRLSAATRANLDLIEGRVAHMHALIDGVLRVARAGAIDDRVVRVDVRELVQEVLDVLGVPATVKVELGGLMPTLHTSRIALEQVLLNLVSNAVKYAARDGAVVKIDVAEQPNRYLFSVADNGPGIAPQHHERVWKIFQVLGPGSPSDGTGIGLAIVRKIVELRGGRAWLESTLGGGATFFFTWPKEEGSS